MHISPWFSWLYNYAVGGGLFAAGLLIALRSGALQWSRPRDRRVALILVLGFALFMSSHAFWIALAGR